MSKVCIVAPANLINVSLISLYTHYFDKNGILYDLIYWNRRGLSESSTAYKTYCFEERMGSCSKLQKIMLFVKYRGFIKNILLKNDYELVITWQTSMAYLLYDVLLGKYRRKYIINIRDYISEQKPVFRRMIKCLVANSALNTISSEGFLDFLPKSDYCLIQSVNEDIIEAKVPVHSKSEEIIRIGYVGTCRYFDENFALIDRLANDKRFELWFCGANSEVLQKYADEKNINNVFSIGVFDRSETLKLLRSCDMINSCFGASDLANITLIPIRLFSALSQGLPVIASTGTYLSRLLEHEHLGISVDTKDDGIGDVLFNYFNNVDWQDFTQKSQLFLDKAIMQNRQFEKELSNILKH